MKTITRESIMNFEVGNLVKFKRQWYRVKKIDRDRIFILYRNKITAFHYSHFTSKPPQLYVHWQKEEIKLLYSGLPPKELSKKLNRNILCIYNKMRLLGIEIVKVKTEKQLLKETYIKTRLKKTHALSDEFVGGNLNKVNK